MIVHGAEVRRDNIFILLEAGSLPGVAPLLGRAPRHDVIIRAPGTGHPLATTPGARVRAANRLVEAVVCLRRVDASAKVADPRAPTIELGLIEEDGLPRRVRLLLGASGRGRTSVVFYACGPRLRPWAGGRPWRRVVGLQDHRPRSLVAAGLLTGRGLGRGHRRALVRAALAEPPDLLLLVRVVAHLNACGTTDAAAIGGGLLLSRRGNLHLLALFIKTLSVTETGLILEAYPVSLHQERDNDPVPELALAPGHMCRRHFDEDTFPIDTEPLATEVLAELVRASGLREDSSRECDPVVRRPVKEPANPGVKALLALRALVQAVRARRWNDRRLIRIGRHCRRRGRRVTGRPKLTRHLGRRLVSSPRVIGHELVGRRLLLLLGRALHGIVFALCLVHEGIDPS